MRKTVGTHKEVGLSNIKQSTQATWYAPLLMGRRNRKPQAMTTEYRREAARKRRGDSRLSDTGGFFHTQNQIIHIFTAAQRQKVRTIYGIF